MNKEIASELVQQAERLFRNTERGNATTMWDLISEFMSNNQSGIYVGQDSPGAKKTTRVFDSTAMQVSSDLASAIHSVMTNPATPWMSLRFSEDDLNDTPDAIEWLQDTEHKLLSAINNSNFTNEVSKGYRSFVTIGNMALLQDVDLISGVRFRAIHLSELAFAENARGIVDVVYRKFPLTAKQAYEQFGDKLSEAILETYEKEPEREYKFLQCIYPNNDYKKDNPYKTKLPKDRPFISKYIDLCDNSVVKIDGYYEFPIHVVRWETMPGEVYGRGPGHIALPDVRTLNRVKQLGLQAISKAINPPIFATQRAIFGQLDLTPNQINIVRELDGIKEFRTVANFDVTQFAVADLQKSINSIFFIDKLLLPPRTETGEMTAYEVAQRVEQMQRVLGPQIARLNSELLDPIIKRQFSIMMRAKQFKEMPDILTKKSSSLQINYINPLARSQRISEVTNIQSWLQDLMALAQVKPEVLDFVDQDAIARLTGKIRGVPEIVIRNQDAVDQIRSDRAKQMQAQQALETGNKMADIQAKTAPKGGQNGQTSAFE